MVLNPLPVSAKSFKRGQSSDGLCVPAAGRGCGLFPPMQAGAVNPKQLWEGEHAPIPSTPLLVSSDQSAALQFHNPSKRAKKRITP